MASTDRAGQLWAAVALQAVLGALPAPPAPEPEPEPAPPPPPNYNRQALVPARRRVDALVEATTGDHRWAQGAQVSAQGAETRVYLALATRRGSASWNPRLGSRLHLLSGDKSLASRRVRALDYAREALQDQVRQGLLTDLAIEAELEDGRLSLRIEARDGQSGRPVAVFFEVV
jgi:phage gp46-like protein